MSRRPKRKRWERKKKLTANQAFVDALREVLGLQPLYEGERGPYHKFRAWMTPPGRGMRTCGGNRSEYYAP